MKDQLINSHNDQIELEKSDQVQTIIDRMPINGIYQVTFATFILISLVIALGFIIKYPDTVDGRISITAKIAPVRLVSAISGKIILLVSDNESVYSGKVIGYIDNSADYADIVKLKKIVNNYTLDKHEIPLDSNLNLGELTSQYYKFELLYKQYSRFRHENIYQPIQLNIIRQIEFDSMVLQNIDEELLIRSHILNLSLTQHKKDSILFDSKSISEVDFNRHVLSIMDLKAAFKQFQTNRSNILSKLAASKIELSKYKLEETEKRLELESTLSATLNDIRASIKLWEQKYELITPINGNVEFADFWRDNSFVQANEELFYIVPNCDSIFGEMRISANGAGKTAIGQKVNIKLDDFPYDEFGIITGIVSSISKISNSINTPQGDMENYRIKVSFPKKLTTSFGLNLKTNLETKGNAEIITRPKRLIHRLFDNLKANTIQ